MAEDLKDLIAKAAEVLCQEGAREVYVFGSAATGRRGTGSVSAGCGPFIPHSAFRTPH